MSSFLTCVTMTLDRYTKDSDFRLYNVQHRRRPSNNKVLVLARQFKETKGLSGIYFSRQKIHFFHSLIGRKLSTQPDQIITLNERSIKPYQLEGIFVSKQIERNR